jgi:hypothetical protein
VALAALGLALAAGCAPARGAGRERPSCAVARVGDDVVTVADSDVVRALVQPPLTRGEAKRLAVTATVAYRGQAPQGALAPVDERLAAYRRALRQGAAPPAPPVEPGACWGGPS